MQAKLFEGVEDEKPKRRVDGHAAKSGSGPLGKTCRDCEHCERVRYHDKKYIKCGLMRAVWTHGGGTDIRAKDAACRLFVRVRLVGFNPPTIGEVAAYVATRKKKIDPEAFVDHYTSNGWSVGKAKMRDWKAAVRNWERRDLNGQQHKVYVPNPARMPEVVPPEKRLQAGEGRKIMQEAMAKVREGR
jgi:hypothetical protein